MEGHWAKDVVDEWYRLGITSGYEDGRFRPDASIQRAELVALINRAFGFVEAGSAGAPTFIDVPAGAWFAADVARSQALGYISGYTDGTFRPSQAVTRQEAAVILARLMGSAGVVGAEEGGPEATGPAPLFADDGALSNWSRDAIYRVAAAGLMQGYPDGTFGPLRPISRAEAVVVLDRLLASGAYRLAGDQRCAAAGTYGPAVGSRTVAGTVTIAAPGVTLQNTIIDGDLIIAEAVGDGDVTLRSVEVRGTTWVRGGGTDSVYVEDSSLGRLIIERVDGRVRVVVQGTTSIGETEVTTGSVLEVTDPVTGSFGTVTVTGDEVTLSGHFGELIVAGPVQVNVASGHVDSLTISPAAAGAHVQGPGTIGSATVRAGGVTIEQSPAAVHVDQGVTVIIDGQPVSGGAVNPPGGGIPGGGSPGGGTPSNRPPAVIGLGLADLTVAVGDSATVSLAGVFDDPDNDPLTFSATSDDAAVATAAVVGSDLIINGVAAGTATMSVTAKDGRGGQATDTFTVTVQAPGPGPGPEPQTLTEAKAAATVALGALAATNDTTAADVLAAVQAVVTNGDIDVSIDDFAKTPATIGSDGSISGTVNLALDGDSELVPINLIITALPAATYAITVAGVQGGTATVTTSPAAEAAAGADVTVTIADVEAGKRFKSLTVTTAGGTVPATAVTVGESYTFTMPAEPVTVSVELEPVPVVTALSVKAPPLQSVYDEGDVLDLTGLIVTLTYSDATSEDVALADFAARGIATVPAAGDTLGLADTSVTITHVASGNSATVPITVTTVGERVLVSIADVPDVELFVGAAPTAGDALARLAATTTITDHRGDTHAVALTWAIDAYDGNEPGVYEATATFALPDGIVQPEPAIALSVTADVRVYRDVPLAYFTGDGNVIVLDFGAPLSAPTGSNGGLMRYGTSSDQQYSDDPKATVQSVALDTDPSRIRVRLYGRVVSGTYDLRYYSSSGQLRTLDGMVMTGFTQLLVTGLRPYVEGLKGAGYDATQVADKLTGQGLTPWALAYAFKFANLFPEVTDAQFADLMFARHWPAAQIADALKAFYGTSTSSMAGILYAHGIDAATTVPILVKTAGGMQWFNLVAAALSGIGYDPLDVAAAFVEAHRPDDPLTAGQLAALLYRADYSALDIARVFLAHEFDAIEIAGILDDMEPGYSDYQIAVTLAHAYADMLAALPALPDEEKADVQAHMTEIALAIAYYQKQAHLVVGALAQAGVTAPRDVAEAVIVADFPLNTLVSALWPLFRDAPAQTGEFGPLLEDAGYSLLEAVPLVLGIGGDTGAVAAAWPGLFGDAGALLPATDIAGNLRARGQSLADTQTLIRELDPTISYAETAQVLSAAGYSLMEIGAWLHDRYQYNIDRRRLTAAALQHAGYDADDIVAAVATLYGGTATDMWDVLTELGMVDVVDNIAVLRAHGYTPAEVVEAVWRNMSHRPEWVSPYLNIAGFTVDEAYVYLGKVANLSGDAFTIEILSSSTGGVGAYSTADIAYVFQTRRNAPAYTTGFALLKGGHALADVATALAGLYGLDAAGFVDIRNDYYTDRGIPLTAGLTGDPPGSDCLLCIMDDVFGLDALEAAGTLRDVARAGTAIDYYVGLILNHYGVTDRADQVRIMTEAGYTTAEIAEFIRWHAGDIGQAVAYLRDAGYSAEATAHYLQLDFSASAHVATDLLIAHGYGSCAELDEIIIALRQVYALADPDLITLLTVQIDCDPAAVNAALARTGTDLEQLARLATERLKSRSAAAGLAVAQLRDVFGYNDVAAIANMLHTAGYDAFDIVVALRHAVGLPVADAEALLALDGVTEQADVFQALRNAGYSLEDTLTLLDTFDPLSVANYLSAAGYAHPYPIVLRMFGPGSGYPDPHALVANLRQLGANWLEATLVLEGFGYEPVQVGAWLWSNGYSLTEVSAGIMRMMPVKPDGEDRPLALAKLYKQLTECGPDLAGMPLCASGQSTFTEADMFAVLKDQHGLGDGDCTAVHKAYCHWLLETLHELGYDDRFAVSYLVHDLHLPVHETATMLLASPFAYEPEDFVALFEAAPFDLTLVQIVEVMRHGVGERGYFTLDIYDYLYDDVFGYGNMEKALRTMIAAGFDVETIATTMFQRGTFTRKQAIRNLQALGYSFWTARSAVYAVKPVTDEELLQRMHEGLGRML